MQDMNNAEELIVEHTYVVHVCAVRVCVHENMGKLKPLAIK